jgi:hypothetical protein
MRSGILCVSWLAATLSPATALTDDAVRISIINEYEATIDFGFLGKGTRGGVDEVKGVLRRQGSQYVGVVDAHVVSSQELKGLGGTGNCGPETYDDSQKLRVVGRDVDDFNFDVQSIDYTVGGPGNDHFLLEFTPETPTTQQPSDRSDNGDYFVKCHTLIESEATARSGMPFLPLNDSRWTQPGGGYIIALPSSGVLEYFDYEVPEGDGVTRGPFQAKKSMWKIRVERLP